MWAHGSQSNKILAPLWSINNNEGGAHLGRCFSFGGLPALAIYIKYCLCNAVQSLAHSVQELYTYHPQFSINDTLLFNLAQFSTIQQSYPQFSTVLYHSLVHIIYSNLIHSLVPVQHSNPEVRNKKSAIFP